MTLALPDGFTIRAPTMDDAPAVTDLARACSIAQYGVAYETVEGLRGEWQWPGFSLATDAWVVISPQGQIVGYAYLLFRGQVQYYALADVHPDYCGQGIGTYLLGRTETRVRERIPEAPAGARVVLRQFVSSVNDAKRRLLELAGYVPVQYDWMMEIELTEAPSPPQWPAGIAVRSFVPGQDDRAVHATQEEAFQDHRGHLAITFEQWHQHMQQRESFDPTLWFLAMDGVEIAGESLCYILPNGLGEVENLAVRRPWRRQGLGMALLLHSFGEFYRRGIRKVSLGVDAQSLTGATRLYEKAGMHIVRQYARYEKELRPGVELSPQALAE
jgi:mycothiol synthase